MTEQAQAELHVSFLRHANWRWAKLALLLSVASIALYLTVRPPEGPSGSSPAGYALGTLAAALIVWLLLLGLRKRAYRSTLGSVRGWVSAHVWLGLALALIATLHAGFQLGWNIHSLAWLLMMIVVVSGAIGVVAYLAYPQRIARLHGGRTRDERIAEVLELHRQMLSLADRIGPEVHARMLESVESVRIGGGLWRQLLGPRRRRRRGYRAVAEALERERAAARDGMQDTRAFMASQIVRAGRTPERGEQLASLLELVARRDRLVDELNREITWQARMRAWLLLHVPLSVALLAALIAHVVSVFVYW